MRHVLIRSTHCALLVAHCSDVYCHQQHCTHSSAYSGLKRKERNVVYSQYVGARVRRKEDPRLITGSSTYVADVQLPGLLHCAILRSPYAHARINSIDASAALALP